MTKNEALKAAIDGKRFRHWSWHKGVYAFFDGNEYRAKQDDSNAIVKMGQLKEESGYEIVPAYVTFAEAWAAYEAGKRIKSVPSNEFEQGCSIQKGLGGYCFRDSQIRGQWQILD